MGNPAVYDFVITNKGAGDTFEIYSLVGFSMSPKGTFELPMGKKTIEVTAYPDKGFLKNRGSFDFEYQIRGQNSGIFKDTLDIKIISLENALEIKPQGIKPGDASAAVTIRNLYNTQLDNVDLIFNSALFTSEVKGISLKPFEQKNVSVSVNAEKMEKLNAGPYVVDVEIKLGKAQGKVRSVVQYLEKEGTSVTRDDSGLIIRKTTITKKNEGNVNAETSVDLKKNIISRLFTVYSVDPDKVDRQSLTVTYQWERELSPGESFVVVATTNYTLPFIIIILVVVIVFLLRFYSFAPLVVDKRVSHVKTRGGEFALKVVLHVKAKKNCGNVTLTDTLPHSTRLYEGYGKKPDRIDESTRRLSWNVGRMGSGEEKVFSYVIYSKVRVVGKFELPSARAVFDCDGKREDVMSNRTYFLSDIEGS